MAAVITYKHSATGDVVTRVNGVFHYVVGGEITQETIRKDIVLKGGDWVCENPAKPQFSLIIVGNQFTFVNTVTEQVYRIGDKITIRKGHSFGDGVRDFTIASFYISDQQNSATNCFEYVYVKTTDGRDIHLNDVVYQ